MRMLSVALWIFSAFNLSHGQDLEPDEHEGVEDRKAQVDSMQTWLESVTNMDELLELLYPDYSLVHHCLRQALQSNPSQPPPPKNAVVRTPRETSTSKVDPIKAILSEMQHTACIPREECVEVTKEHPESTSSLFKPRCVSVHRCGGCCIHEGQECVSTRQNLVQKTLSKVSPVEMSHSIVIVTFVNHTACECQPKEALHTIRRRATSAHFSQCSPPDVPCSPEMVWDPTDCQCVSKNLSPVSAKELEPLDAALLALCGPNKVLNREECKCMCQNGLTEASCGPSQTLDEASCQCVCRKSPTPGVCPPNQTWDLEQCGCICRTDCPTGQHRDPKSCQCQCRESLQSCRLSGKMFRRKSCRCYRQPVQASTDASQLPRSSARWPQIQVHDRDSRRVSPDH
ncbi:vascular endothelial growth factor C-like [Arapaima gigas]